MSHLIEKSWHHEQSGRRSIVTVHNPAGDGCPECPMVLEQADVPWSYLELVVATFAPAPGRGKFRRLAINRNEAVRIPLCTVAWLWTDSKGARR